MVASHPMNSVIKNLIIIQYFDDKPWKDIHISNPRWEELVQAIQQME